MRVNKANLEEKRKKNQQFCAAVDFLIREGRAKSQKELSERTGIMASTISNVRTYTKFVTEQTIKKLLSVYPDAYSFAQVKEQESQVGIIDMYAQLIRRVDDLRNDLAAELETLRREREEIKEERRVMHQLIHQLQQRIGYPQPYEENRTGAIMVAEPEASKTKD